VLEAFASMTGGQFMVADDREGLANAIRKKNPSSVIIDDAQAHEGWIEVLRTVRQQVGASFGST